MEMKMILTSVASSCRTRGIFCRNIVFGKRYVIRDNIRYGIPNNDIQLVRDLGMWDGNSGNQNTEGNH
jgi:hypothetical protein